MDDTLVDDIQRLSRLNEENQLTDEEYELLKSNLLNTSTKGTETGSTTQDTQATPTASKFLTNGQISDLVEAYQSMIQDDNYDEKSDVQIDIPEHSMVVANMSYDDPPAILHNFIFDEEGQKDRLQELVAEDRYEITLEFEK